LLRLARLERVRPAREVRPNSAQIIVGEATYALPLEGVIDIGVERARLEKEHARLAAEIAAIDKKLSNGQFVARAPEDVIEEQRTRREETSARQMRIADALSRLR
jgi:valyl-tRNA synthetase